GHARPEPARPDELIERPEARALVDELLDLMQQRLALLAIGLARLLLEERLDVRVGAARVGALALHGVGQARGRIAEVGHRAHADAVQLLARPRGLERGALHRAHLHLDACRTEKADDGLARRPVRWIRIEVTAV